MAKQQQKKPQKSSKKTTPKKVIAKVKDQKKVDAGKVRQATGIKNEKGQFVSKIFTNAIKKTILATKKFDVSKINADQTAKIDELIKEAKITPLQIKRYYDQNKDIFEDLNTFGKLKGTSKNKNQIDKAIDNYKGKIFVNNGLEIIEVSKVELKFQLAQFDQLLSSNINLVNYILKPTMSIEGTMQFNLPDVKDFRKKIKDRFEITNMKQLDEFETADVSEILKELLQDYFGKETDIVLIIS